MAATQVRNEAGPTSKGLYELGIITFDADATVEIPTYIRYIKSITFTEIGAGGSVDMPSVNETVDATGVIKVPASGSITVEMTGVSARAFQYRIEGM